MHITLSLQKHNTQWICIKLIVFEFFWTWKLKVKTCARSKICVCKWKRIHSCVNRLENKKFVVTDAVRGWRVVFELVNFSDAGAAIRSLLTVIKFWILKCSPVYRCMFVSVCAHACMGSCACVRICLYSVHSFCRTGPEWLRCWEHILRVPDAADPPGAAQPVPLQDRHSCRCLYCQVPADNFISCLRFCLCS